MTADGHTKGCVPRIAIRNLLKGELHTAHEYYDYSPTSSSGSTKARSPTGGEVAQQGRGGHSSACEDKDGPSPAAMGRPRAPRGTAGEQWSPANAAAAPHPPVWKAKPPPVAKGVPGKPKPMPKAGKKVGAKAKPADAPKTEAQSPMHNQNPFRALGLNHLTFIDEGTALTEVDGQPRVCGQVLVLGQVPGTPVVLVKEQASGVTILSTLMLPYARHLGCDAAGRRDLVRLSLADGDDVVDHAAVAERLIEDALAACSAEGRRRVRVLGGVGGGGGGVRSGGGG